MAQSSVDFIGYIYALTVAAGGLIGYIKAGSIPSLVAGLTFGALSCVGAYQISQSDNHLLMLCGSGLLGILMGVRFYKGRKFMPAGLIFVASALMFGRSIYAVTH